MSINHRKTLYLAAPYTHPDPVINTHAVIKCASIVFEDTAWVPVVPHLSLLWHAIAPRPIEYWYELDIHLMLHCDAVVRLPGKSSGADNELTVAADEGMTILDYSKLPLAARRAWEQVC